MRFVCESCQTRYIIPDERARGRVLKVRCKKCGHIIILRPASEAASELPEGSPASVSPGLLAASPPSTVPTDESTQMVDAEALKRLRDDSRQAEPGSASRPPSSSLESEAEASPPAPKEANEWHALLSGEQVGPLTMSELIERLLSGAVTPRTFIWRDGMSDWKRTEDVADVARWLPAKPSPTPAASVIPAAPSPSPATVPKKRAKAKPETKPEPAVAASAEPAAAGASPEVLDSAAVDELPFAPVSAGARVAAVDPVDDPVAAFFDGAEPSEPDPTPVPVARPSRSAPPADPFARVADAPGLSQPKPGEVTKFFITQAGVTKQHSPWRLVAFAAGAALMLLGGLVGLSQLGVSVPMVGNSGGDGASHKVFSGNSESGNLGDLLLGRRRKPASAKPAPRAVGSSGPSAATADQGPLAKKPDQHVERLAAGDVDTLKQLYDKKDPITVKPSVGKSEAPVIDRSDAPLTPDQVAKTVARFQNGYTACIDRELKRNPNFQGGKIRIVTTIMSSGLVRHAQIESDNARLAKVVSAGDLGSCLTDQTRRMVFPSFSGDPFDAEIPLVVGASL